MLFLPPFPSFLSYFAKQKIGHVRTLQYSVVFAMEYLPGGDLYQRLADKGTLPLGETVAWVAQAVLAIEDLHALNIVHRDIKPGRYLGQSSSISSCVSYQVSCGNKSLDLMSEFIRKYSYF